MFLPWGVGELESIRTRTVQMVEKFLSQETQKTKFSASQGLAHGWVAKKRRMRDENGLTHFPLFFHARCFAK